MARIDIKRRIIHVGGFDAMPPEHVRARLLREHSRFQRCWGVTGEAGAYQPDIDLPRWTMVTSGEGWRVESEHIVLRWDDVIKAEHAQPPLKRWVGGLAAGADFVAGGALAGYLRHAPRYALFFLFPFVLILLIALIAILVGHAGSAWFGLAGGALAAGAAFAGLVWLAKSKVPLSHLLDDWTFARRYLRVPDHVIDRRAKAGAALIAATPPDTDLLVVGHSLGAAVAMEMLAAAISNEPDGRRLSFLSLGSSVLKLALHRDSKRLRAQVAAVAASPRVTWVEYQAVNDVMNFFRTDPVAILGLAGRSPTVRKVRFGDMLEPAYYRSIKLDFFRLHCQFVSGNDRRAAFDYLMALCGPLPIGTLARLRGGPAEAYGDGAALKVEAAQANEV